MPIFEFRCGKCKKIFEVLCRNRDEALSVSCPACKSVKTERLLSAFAGKIGNTSAGGGCGSCTSASCPPS